MSADSELERRRLAYRRAGYAIARHTQGRPLRSVGMDPREGDDEGRRRAWPVDLGSRARHDLEMEILARWAGLEAEARGCLEGRAPEGGWGKVREPVAELGRRVTRGEDENDAYLEWLRRRAAGLLDLPGEWPAVEAVAERLLETGLLREQEITLLATGHLAAHRRASGLRGLFRDVR